MKHVNPETLKYQTSELVREFIELKGEPLQGESIEDAVYEFFGGRFYGDNTLSYQHLSVWMLSALAKPDVQEVLQKHLQFAFKDLIELFARLHAFAEIMDGERHKAANELHQLEYFITGEEPYLKNMFYRYAAKTAGLRAELEVKAQQDNYLKNARYEN